MTGHAPRKRLSYKEQREYDSIEGEIEALEQKSRELETQIEQCATDHIKLAELSKEKDETDQLLDEKMERFLELQDLVESLQKT